MAVAYTRGYVVRIMVLDAINVIIGLAIFVLPFARGWYPGSFDTTVHVALGLLIAVPAVFRVLVGYEAFWVEVVEVILGVLVMNFANFMHMQWNPAYTDGHMAAGALVILIALISGSMTVVERKKIRAAQGTAAAAR